MWTRRQLLKSGMGAAAAVSLAGPLPFVLGQSARRAAETGTGRILVVLQLTGGNDGLNTLVPFGDDAYYRNRFSLALRKEQVVPVSDYAGMHPSLRPLENLLDEKRLAFVQGVGYPRPNRSHFESLDLWHTAHRMEETRILGWLGRADDLLESGPTLPAVHLGGDTQPLALAGDRRQAMSIRSIDSFRLRVAEQAAARKFLELSNLQPREMPSGGLQHIHSTMNAATEASRRLAELPASSDRGAAYPNNGLGTRLRQVADLIAAEIPVRVYYLSLGGFDTHANQLAAHASLLSELAGSVSAFLADLTRQGNADRVLVMTFSEFGRRVRENASRGTDHGAASIVQLAGPVMGQTLLGSYPSLTDLDEGDLKFSTDYRRLYSAVLEQWLGVDPVAVLGGRFDPMPIFG